MNYGNPHKNLCMISIAGTVFWPFGQTEAYSKASGRTSPLLLKAPKASNRITVHTDNKVYATSDTTHSQPYFFTCASSPDSQITCSRGIFSIRTRDNYSMADHPVVMVTWWGATAFCNTIFQLFSLFFIRVFKALHL